MEDFYLVAHLPGTPPRPAQGTLLVADLGFTGVAGELLEVCLRLKGGVIPVTFTALTPSARRAKLRARASVNASASGPHGGIASGRARATHGPRPIL